VRITRSVSVRASFCLLSIFSTSQASWLASSLFIMFSSIPLMSLDYMTSLVKLIEIWSWTLTAISAKALSWNSLFAWRLVFILISKVPFLSFLHSSTSPLQAKSICFLIKNREILFRLRFEYDLNIVLYLGPGVSKSSMLCLWVVGGLRSGESPILPLLRLWSVAYAWHLQF